MMEENAVIMAILETYGPWKAKASLQRTVELHTQFSNTPVYVAGRLEPTELYIRNSNGLEMSEVKFIVRSSEGYFMMLMISYNGHNKPLDFPAADHLTGRFPSTSFDYADPKMFDKIVAFIDDLLRVPGDPEVSKT